MKPQMISAYLFAAMALVGQTVMSFSDIEKLLVAKISEETITARVKRTGKPVDLNPDEMIALKKAGASDNLIRQIIEERSVGADMTPANATRDTTNPAASRSLIPEEVGAYFDDSSGKLKPLAAEVVRSGSTSPFRVMATGGFGALKVKGKVAGAKSPLQLSGTIVLVLRCPEGSSPDAFQLLIVEAKKDSREFTTGKMSMFRGMSTSPDEKDVKGAAFEKLGSNTYRTKLEGLKPGEYLVYGYFGMPNGGPMGSLGRMYTFGVAR